MQRILRLPKTTGVTSDEFKVHLQRLYEKMPTMKESLESKRIGIAVSGGADSLALAYLASQAIPLNRLMAFMVDHGLEQRGVTENPSDVSLTLQNLGLKHEILSIDWSCTFWDSLTKGKLLEKTRQLRFEALFKACRRHDIPLLLTGHNLDDDIVTMFYRMAHLSGIDGLGSMKAAAVFPVANAAASKFFVGHPLLDIPKARLSKTCEHAQLEPVLDRSNLDLDFRRNSIQDCIVKIQESNPKITTESLERVLKNFKRVREDVHEELVKVFDKSVVVNRVNGDCTLILNDEAWLKRRYLTTRLLTVLLQYSAAHSYPARTPSITNLYRNLIEAFQVHKEERLAWLNKISSSTRNSEVLQPFDKTKRVVMKQHTLGGCTVYSLSRLDAMRRIALQAKLEGRNLEYGPAFLIQREPPHRIKLQSAGFGATEITLSPRQPYLWDNRVYLSFDPANDQDIAPRRFSVSFMTPGDVKDFEQQTASMRSARRRVYAYLGTTPGTHLYQIPVIREIGTDYMAFPTLKADFPIGKYKWKTSYAGTSVLVSRFLCLP